MGKKEAQLKIMAPAKKTKDSLGVVQRANASPARIRKIGNSRGILLSNNLLNHLGVKEGEEITIFAEPGQIIIKPAAAKAIINTDLSTWEAQFKQAIKNGETPEGDMFEGMDNTFDKEEW